MPAAGGSARGMRVRATAGREGSRGDACPSSVRRNAMLSSLARHVHPAHRSKPAAVVLKSVQLELVHIFALNRGNSLLENTNSPVSISVCTFSPNAVTPPMVLCVTVKSTKAVTPTFTLGATATDRWAPPPANRLSAPPGPASQRTRQAQPATAERAPPPTRLASPRLACRRAGRCLLPASESATSPAAGDGLLPAREPVPRLRGAARAGLRHGGARRRHRRRLLLRGRRLRLGARAPRRGRRRGWGRRRARRLPRARKRRRPRPHC